MLHDLWFSYLFQPLLNFLIWIYNEIASQNMGWAVIILTVFLRIALLPLSVISQRDTLRRKKVEVEARKAVEVFKADRVAMNEEYRKIIRANRISPWAKVTVLGIQVVVLIVLYRVFMSGIFGEKLVSVLYQSVSFPGEINNNFYGHNVGLSHDWVWAGMVAIYLFIVNFIEKFADRKWEKSEAVFLILFPLFTFTFLWILPMAKSLFILTSIVFSDILTLARIAVFPSKENAEKT